MNIIDILIDKIKTWKDDEDINYLIEIFNKIRDDNQKYYTALYLIKKHIDQVVYDNDRFYNPEEEAILKIIEEADINV